MKIKFRLNYNQIYFIHVIVIAIYMILSIIFILASDLFKGFSMDGFHNNFCKENSDNIICDNKYKKKKFFYCLLDGVAYDQLYELRKKDKYNITRIFRGVTSDYKQSAVNFQIIMSGKINRNFIGASIKEDNLFYNFFHKGMKFTFRGIKLVIYGLVGRFFEKYKITPTEINSMDTMCDFGIDIEDNYVKNLINKISDKSGYLKKEYDKEYLYQKLDEHFSKELNIINERGDNDFMTKCLKDKFRYTGEENIIYYGNKIDHINHNFDKNHIRVLIQMYLTEKILIRSINWCWDHPEYAFFYASDHGGQNFYGEDNVMNHGYNSLGNEAVFFGWTKELAENYEKLKLKDKIVSLFDFSTLIPQIIEGSSIPLESLGIPHPFANDKLFYITSIKSKAQQLLKYIELFLGKYPKNEKILEKYNNIINNIYKSNDEILLKKEEDFMKELKNLQNEIDDAIIRNNKNILFEIAFYIIFMALSLIIIYDIYILKNIIKYNNYFFIFVVIFGLYYAILCILLYPSKIVYNKLYISTIYQYYIFTFVFLCYLIFNYQKIKGNNIRLSILFMIVLFNISTFSILFYKYEIFTKMKRLFTNEIIAKLCDYFIFYPLFGFYLTREIFKLEGFYFDKNYKYSAKKYLFINGILMFIFMILFEIFVPTNFEFHSIYSLLSNNLVLVFLFIFFISCFLKYYSKNDNRSYKLGEKSIIDGFPLLKLFLMIYQFYLSDEAERTLLLFIVIPILEFMTSKFLREEKMWKLIVLVFLMGLGEIFYLITQRYYSFDISIKVSSRTWGIAAEDTPLYTGILMGTHKLRYLMLLQGYLFYLSRFYKNSKEFFTQTSFMIRIVPYMQLIGKIIYFYFRYYNHLVGEEFLELFMWTMFHVIMFLVDFVALLFFAISNRIYNISKSELILKEETKIETSMEKIK